MAKSNKVSKIKKAPQQPKKETIKKKPGNLSPENIRIIVYLLLMAIVFVPTYNHIFDKKAALLGDNAAYYIFGKALANGDGYVNANIISKPQASQFPPGYPAFMATVMKVFNDKVTTIKTANGFLLFLSLIILFFFFRQISKNIHLSFILAAALIFNMHLLQYSSMMMSEIPFLFISSLSLWLLTMVKFEKKPWTDIWFLFLILAVAGSYYVRGQGLAVFFGIFLFMLIDKKWIHLALTTVGYFLLLLPWQIRNSGLPETAYAKALKLKNYYNPDEGLMQMSDWIHRFFVNLERYMTHEIPSAMFGYQADYQASGSWAAGIFIAIIVIFGFIKLKKYRWAVGGYIVATFGILFLWPEIWNGIRFVLALVPLLIFLFYYGIFSGIVFLAEKAKIKNMNFIHNSLPFFFVIAAFIYVGKLEVLHKEAKKNQDPLYRNYFALAEWTKKNLPDTAVIICRKPNLFYLKSQHFVNGFSKVSDMDKFMESLNTKETTHIVVYGDGITQRYFIPVYQKNPEKFPVIQQFKNPDVYLLAYKPNQGYSGEWNGDVKEGQGTYNYPDGRKYIGEWKNNKMNGKGILYAADGTILQDGVWKEGVFQNVINE